jgi:hypothetical protein
MPALTTYRIFISHAWDYNEDYYRLIKYLDAAPNFQYANYSVPEHDPVAGGGQLAENIRDQIRPVQVVLILAGMYAAHSDWIQFEIEFAQGLAKPMVGIRPWGADRIPQVVQESVDEMVGWNTDSIVDAIRRHAR